MGTVTPPARAADIRSSGSGVHADSCEVDVDDATWERGRGWALALGVGAVDVYQKSNPVLAAIGRRSIAEVLTER